MVACPHCARENPDVAGYCGACGRELPDGRWTLTEASRAAFWGVFRVMLWIWLAVAVGGGFVCSFLGV